MEKRNMKIEEVNLVELDKANLREFQELVKLVEDNVGIEKRDKVFINSNVINERAKKNPYIKDYLDKIIYDEHNKRVEEAKSRGDKKELQVLSNNAMRLAGYIEGENQVNEFAKSYVDRTFFDREINKLYKAKAQDNQELVEAIYKRIYEMSSSETNKPFYVENQYARNFVELNIEQYRQMELDGKEQTHEDERYAI